MRVRYDWHKSERAISLARSRPLSSEFQRSGSGPRSQRLLSWNRSAPTGGARVFTSLFYDPTRCKSFPSAVRFQLPGSSLVADTRRRLLVRSLLLEDHSSSEINTTLSPRECHWFSTILCCGNMITKVEIYAHKSGGRIHVTHHGTQRALCKVQADTKRPEVHSIIFRLAPFWDSVAP